MRVNVPFLPLNFGVSHFYGSIRETPFYVDNKKKAQQILSRDQHCCRFCGFTADNYQRVISCVTPDHEKPVYVTACPFCEGCKALDKLSRFANGVFIWLPEITQAKLNNLMQALYTFRYSNAENLNFSTKLIDLLMNRKSDAKKKLGTDDPSILATILQEEIKQKEYSALESKLEGIRLFYTERNLNKTDQANDEPLAVLGQYWSSTSQSYESGQMEKWEALYKKIT